MTDRMDERLRSHLSSVDNADVASAEAIGAGVARSQRRHERTRRVALGGSVAALLIAGSIVVWNSGEGPERITSGDGGSPTTVAVNTTLAQVVPMTGPSSTPVAPQVGWEAIPPNPRGVVSGATVVWTGSEAVSVGGDVNDGVAPGVTAYSPSTGLWRDIAADVPLLAPIVTWTGESVLAVGWTASGRPRSVAASLSLDSGEWTILADAPAPDKLWSNDAWVWTGTELLVMSGVQEAEAPTVQAFNPTTNTWRMLASAPIAHRFDASSVWTGTEWLIWGGGGETDSYADGVAYNPATDSYRPLAKAPLSARAVRGVWTGAEMVLLAGTSSGGNAESDGAAYSPQTDTWRSTKPGFGHPGFVPVWTGSLIIQFAKGGAVWYNPALDEWGSGDMTFGEVAHDDRSPVWTGSQVVLLGSYDSTTGGATFTPSS